MTSKSSHRSGSWAGSQVKIAYGTDCGMFPFSHGVLEFQAMAKAGLSPVRALKAGTSIAAELLGRGDLGVLALASLPISSPCPAIRSLISVPRPGWIS
jgi:hypothetical protein